MNKEMIKGVSVSAIERLSDNDSKIKKLSKVAKANIMSTLHFLEENAASVKIFKISPKLFPLPNYPDTEYTRYIDKFRSILKSIGDIIENNNIRAAIYPENTVMINSMSEKIYEDSIKELKYQNAVLTYMGLDFRTKIVLNIDEEYFRREDADTRLKDALKRLEPELKRRLAFTNGSKIININDVLDICVDSDVPFFLNLNNDEYKDKNVLEKTFKSWEKSNMVPMFGIERGQGIEEIITDISRISDDFDLVIMG